MAEQTSNIPNDDEIHIFLQSCGLLEYDTALREAGLENLQIIHELEENDINELMKDANMNNSDIDKFKNAIHSVRNGTYNSNKQQEQFKYEYKTIESDKPFNKNDNLMIKNLLFIGESRVGKTTLINSMCNYLYNVNYNTKFRYKLIHENENKNNQTQSQTQKITAYYLNKPKNINYSLTIIDTPGFGTDKNDLIIQTQFKKCFEDIKTIDAIYFVVKSTDTRLSAAQKYIINKLLNLFPSSFKDNIYILFTFSDGSDPPALNAVKTLNIAYNKHFKINNSGFTFPAKNKNETHQMYFNLGMQQFATIFSELNNIKPQSTQPIIKNIQTQMNIDNSNTFSTWNLVDVSKLHPSHASLPTKQRRALYEAITKRFRINKDNSIYGDISDNKFATKIQPISFWQEIYVCFIFILLVCFYFMPLIIFVLLFWYFINNGYYISIIIMCLIYVYLMTHTLIVYRDFLQNAWYYVQYNYFSYRIVYHSQTKDYFTHQLMGKKNYKSLLLICIPHAIFPYAIQLAPPLLKELFNAPIVGAMADILFNLPIIRTLFTLNGMISAKKKSIVNTLKRGYNIGLVPDGIAGMFTESKQSENILLKNRKGVAKLSLQTGNSLVCCYGFGNTDLFDSYFDSFGIMKNLSRKLKMSIIFFVGRFWTLAPKRIPLYFVVGPVIKHPNNGVPIQNPTQRQIDEYHEQILMCYQQLFDCHKVFYGWEDKRINFI